MSNQHPHVPANLEQQHKLAKDLLRDARSGDPATSVRATTAPKKALAHLISCTSRRVGKPRRVQAFKASASEDFLAGPVATQRSKSA